MRRGKKANETNTRMIAALPKLWAMGIETVDIAERFQETEEMVRYYARQQGLPPRKRLPPHKAEMSVAERRRQHGKMLGDVRRRHFIQQPDPIVLEPSPSLFGAPLKRLDEETRVLIDKAVARSQQPRRAYHKRRAGT